MKNRFLIGLLAIGLLSSCASSSLTTSSHDSAHADLNALLWQQTSAEYDALCYQAFHTAKTSLMQIKQGGDFENSPMVILDLDETVLNNSPYNGKLLLEKGEYSSESWNEWVNKQEAELIPGALEFIQFAQENGFKIGFISNRDQASLKATIANLSKNGLDFEPRNFMLKMESSSKMKRRQKMAEEASIVMLIGDNLADFADAFDDSNLTLSQRKAAVEENYEFFGYRYIVIPNVMYGNWKKAMELEDTSSEKNLLPGKRKFIKSY